jgi:hydrogenase/urease accessory protein HupE
LLLLLLLLALLGVPAQAQAHSAWAGSNEFANGLLHPIFTPQHVLLLLGLGLLLGQRKPLALKLPFLAFAPATAAALAIMGLAKTTANFEVPLAVLLCLTGLLVALEAQLPRPAVLILFGGAAMALGTDSGPDPGQQRIALTLLGTWLGLVIVLVNVAYYSSLLPDAPWARICRRVAGSWLCAIGFLLIAFALRPQ